MYMAQVVISTNRAELTQKWQSKRLLCHFFCIKFPEKTRLHLIQGWELYVCVPISKRAAMPVR